MDQTTNLAHNDRRRAVARLAEFVAQSVDAARAVEKPFFHLEFDRVFPADLYAQILALMPEATDYRPMHGRSKGHDLTDGTHTRVKIDLFPEYIRNLPPEKRALWDVVGRALCSEPVKQAFIRRLAPGLSKRFGADFAKVGMYPIPILTRDIPGYLITPHTDTRWKGITVQLYLPKDDANTDIGTIFHEKLPDGSLPKKAQMRFAPQQRSCLRGRRRHLALGGRGAHQSEVPRFDPAHLFRRPGAVAELPQPRQAAGQFRAQRDQAPDLGFLCHTGTVRSAGPGIHIPRPGLWIPGSLGARAPRNDEVPH